MTPEQAAALRAPFPPEAIGKIPKGGTRLDYVGHAAVTDRLLSVDPGWTWTPHAVDERGVPVITQRGNDSVMWIKLVVCDVVRFGVGIVPSKSFELEKQLISDAIRNAAMRFGVALDLWSKEDLGQNAEGDRREKPEHASATAERSPSPSATNAERPSDGGRRQQPGEELTKPAQSVSARPGTSPAAPSAGLPVVSETPSAATQPGSPASKIQLFDLQAQLKRMQATGFKVAGFREKAGLPPLNDECTAEELDAWAALLNSHDMALA